MDKRRDDILCQLDDQLWGSVVGYRLLVTVEPNSETVKKCQIEIVVLEDDGAFLAYRYFDDSVWMMGSIEDVADYWVAFLDND